MRLKISCHQRNGSSWNRWLLSVASLRFVALRAHEACGEMESITDIVLGELGAALQFARGSLASSSRAAKPSAHSFLELPAQAPSCFARSLCCSCQCNVAVGECSRGLFRERFPKHSWLGGGMALLTGAVACTRLLSAARTRSGVAGRLSPR